MSPLPPRQIAAEASRWFRPTVRTPRPSHMLGLLALLLSLASGHASAQLMVHPTRVVFDDNQRAAQLEVINNSSQETTYRIELVNRRMDENGGLSMIEAAGPGEQFADSMLRYSPRRVTLAPGASQVVRVMARKPAGLAAGEYRSHLLFSQQAPAAGDNPDADGGESGGGIGIALTALVGVSIPLIVREGETAATVSLANVALSKPSTQPALLSMELHRSGNQSVYGDISVAFTPAAGGAQQVARAGGVAVYTPNAMRRARLPLNPPAGMVLANGTLTVSYRERPADGGRLLAETSLALP